MNAEAGAADAPSPPAHAFDLTVYYEDTDLGGIVYYANYLKFMERARTEWLREAGLVQSRLREQLGLLFVVRRCDIAYRAPARLDDRLRVTTEVQRIGAASIDLAQDVARIAPEPALLTTGRVQIACIGADGRPARLPREWAGRLIAAARLRDRP